MLVWAVIHLKEEGGGRAEHCQACIQSTDFCILPYFSLATDGMAGTVHGGMAPGSFPFGPVQIPSPPIPGPFLSLPSLDGSHFIGKTQA